MPSATAATLWLIALSGLGRLAVAWADGLCYGESYYYACARHPSLSYFDHPPLAIWLGSLTLAVSEDAGRLLLRLPFVLLFAGTTWLLFLLGRRLFSPWAGFLAALLLNLSPIFLVSVGIFFQPDGPLMFFWAAGAWCLARLLGGPPPERPLRWWLAAGAMLGLGLLSKYPAILLAAGAGLYLLVHPAQRRWLRHPGPYLALLLALVLFSPVLVWNAGHEWVSFIFQSTRGMDNFTGLRLDWLGKNIAGQALALLPWIWLGLVLELARGLSRGAEPARRFVAWLSVIPVVAFTAVAAISASSQHHFHWALPGYLLLFLPLGDTVARALAAGSRAYRRGLLATAAVSLLLVAGLASHIATGWLQDLPLVGPALAEDDPTHECIDYAPLAPALAARGLLDRRDLFVFTDSWYRAGKLEYALRGRLPVLAFTQDNPRAFAFFDRSERWVGRDGLLITTKALPMVDHRFAPYFERLVRVGEVTVGRRGRDEVRLHLYWGERLLRPFPQPYGS